MPLIELLNETKLKSLGFGDDRPGGASSNQPYVISPIPSETSINSPDFLLRNGYLNFINSLTDTERIGKWFGDIKSPSGLLFTTKQELLERQNPKLVNIDRVYNPLSTLFQTGLVSTGGHLNKQGLNPSEQGYYNGGKYGYYFSTKNQTVGDGIENRLTIAYTAKVANQELGGLSINPFGITNLAGNGILLSYPGGPGSTLGVGLTNIKILNPTRTVDNIKEDQKFLISFKSTDPGSRYYLNANKPSSNWLYRMLLSGGIFGGGVSSKYVDTLLKVGVRSEITLKTKNDLDTEVFGNDLTLVGKNELQNTILNRSTYQNVLDPEVDFGNSEYISSYQQIIEKNPLKKDTSLSNIKDFREALNPPDSPPVIPATLYELFNREDKYQDSKTTYRGNFKYTNEIGSRIIDPNIAISTDQNELGVMSEDIVDFNFTLILNNNPNDDQNRLIDFKAYIESWSDSSQGEWNEIKYMGRAEKLYKYNGFSRAGSVTFVVPALSRGDMISNYRKLNALMWATAPDYSDSSTPVPGLMRGSIVNFTMGNYFRRMPCIIKSINYTEVEGMGWDINRDTDGTIFRKIGSSTPEGGERPATESSLYVGQLPKGIRVQVDFTPLHNFVPQYGEAFIGQDEIYAPPKTGKDIWKDDLDKSQIKSGIDRIA